MGIDPLAVLAIGIATVLGLILFLRVNAFIALITAAIVVSLLAPGAVATKISRVAEAFGVSAGQIGIVIALAAVIGECMMRSGAADRIVQAFLHLLGEKRASWALLSSGYVLAIPVFFDTVFYLLVPLARSLYRRTGKNYLLSILAIGAGGAITHTLVPPTPGPLLMAATLGVDVGMMILIGGLVAFPAAVVGLGVAAVMDRRLNVPYRELATGKAATVLKDADLPPLWLSVLPVVLPVIMISANTALTTMADNERPARLVAADISDWEAFTSRLMTSETPAIVRLRDQLPADISLEAGEQPNAAVQTRLVEALNARLVSQEPPLYNDAAFETLVRPRWKIDDDLRQALQEEKPRLERELLWNDLLAQDRSKFKLHERERFNRLALEVMFPDSLRPHIWETSLRRAEQVASLFGNANLALLISTAVAIALLYLTQKPSLTEMSEIIETSLMSGGAIILITAGGGAFGAMLKAAQIGPAIENLFKSDSGGATSGLMFLLLGYGVAAILKVAQGSSTVAMITASAMLAAMIGGGDSLGYHPVYLATSIGAGSLMGSWMNDSGFWIFAKMGGLTEVEALKSWTIMLAVMSVVSLVVTLALTLALPMV